MLLALIMACTLVAEDEATGPRGPVGSTPSTPDDSSTPPTVTDTGSTAPTVTTGDTSTFIGTVTDSSATGDTAATGDTGIGFDCSAPWPKRPISVTELSGWTQAEDFDFDGEGFVVSVENQNLFGKDPYGNTRVYTPNVGSWTAGTRALPTGDFVVADAGAGELVLVDAVTGARTVLLGGLNYPNGVEVDAGDSLLCVLGAANFGSQFSQDGRRWLRRAGHHASGAVHNAAFGDFYGFCWKVSIGGLNNELDQLVGDAFFDGFNCHFFFSY